MTNNTESPSELERWVRMHTDLCNAIGNISDEMSRHEPMSDTWMQLLRTSNNLSTGARAAYDMICKLAK